MPRNRSVAAIYDELLSRTASGSEVSYYANLLSRGAREEQIVAGFVASQEYTR